MSATAERIAKLAAKAHSARGLGQLAEAEAFDAKVTELLDRFGLTLAEVEEDLRKSDRSIDAIVVGPDDYGDDYRPMRPVVWMVHLAAVVAAHHECGLVLFGGNNSIGLVGVKLSREAAAAMLCRVARRLRVRAEEAMAEPARDVTMYYTIGDTSTTGNTSNDSTWSGWWAPGGKRDGEWRTSFLCGAAQAVGDRLAAELHSRRSQATNGLALMPLGHRDGVREWFRKHTPETDVQDRPSEVESVQVRTAAFADGQRAAQALNLKADELGA